MLSDIFFLLSYFVNIALFIGNIFYEKELEKRGTELSNREAAFVKRERSIDERIQR